MGRQEVGGRVEACSPEKCPGTMFRTVIGLFRLRTMNNISFCHPCWGVFTCDCFDFTPGVEGRGEGDDVGGPLFILAALIGQLQRHTVRSQQLGPVSGPLRSGRTRGRRMGRSRCSSHIPSVAPHLHQLFERSVENSVRSCSSKSSPLPLEMLLCRRRTKPCRGGPGQWPPPPPPGSVTAVAQKCKLHAFITHGSKLPRSAQAAGRR